MYYTIFNNVGIVKNVRNLNVLEQDAIYDYAGG